jgi:hypothetical protein
MAYGSVLTDTVQSSTAATAPVFKDGNGTQIGTLCRAWVNFNGTGTVAIRASFNVSSITDNGTGDYTINFTNAMPDANYSATTTAQSSSNGTGNTPYTATPSGTATTAFATTAFRMWVKQGSALADADLTSVSIFR